MDPDAKFYFACQVIFRIVKPVFKPVCNRLTDSSSRVKGGGWGRDVKPVMSEPVNRFMDEPVFLKNDPFEKLSISGKTGLNRFLEPVYKATGLKVG